MTDAPKRDWQKLTYMNTAELPRFGMLGQWDRLVARLLRRPLRMSGHEIEVTLWIANGVDGPRIANVQMEFR